MTDRPRSPKAQAPMTDRHIVRPVAARLARAIVAAMDLADDPKTYALWAAGVGVGRGTLREWSYAVGERPRKVIAFVRLLRAIYLSQIENCTVGDLLDTVDDACRSELLERGRVADDGSVLSLSVFLSRQTLLQSPSLLREVREAIAKGLAPQQ